MSDILTAHQSQYYAWQLTRKAASDSVESFAATLVDAQVDLNPHQVDAAVFACQNPLSRGVILADEVGLGKTIEAGLVISQRWAERAGISEEERIAKYPSMEEAMPEIYKQLDLTDVDVLVASACVQMPSLEAIDLIQAECGIPVTSAAVCTTYEMMKKIGIEAKSAIGGELLSGKY